MSARQAGNQYAGLLFPQASPKASKVAIWGHCDSPPPTETRTTAPPYPCQLTFKPLNTPGTSEAISTFDGSISYQGGQTRWRTWMSNLVLVNDQAQAESGNTCGVSWFGISLWLTNITIKGFGKSGVWTRDTIVYLNDVDFVDNVVASDRLDGSIGSSAHIHLADKDPSVAIIDGCTFTDKGPNKSPQVHLVLSNSQASSVILANNTFPPTPPRTPVPALANTTSIEAAEAVGNSSMNVCASSMSSPGLSKMHHVLALGELAFGTCAVSNNNVSLLKMKGVISQLGGASGLRDCTVEWLTKVVKAGVPGASELYKYYFGSPFPGEVTGPPVDKYQEVSTGEELVAAVDEGMKFIKVVEHFDLAATFFEFDPTPKLDPSGIRFNPHWQDMDREIAIWGECDPAKRPGYTVDIGSSPNVIDDTACYMQHVVPAELLLPEPNVTRSRDPILSVMFSTYDDRLGAGGTQRDWQGWFSNFVLSARTTSLQARAFTWNGGNLFLTGIVMRGFDSRVIRTQWTGAFLTNLTLIGNEIGLEADKDGGALQIRLADDEDSPAISVISRCHFERNTAAGCGSAAHILYSPKFDGDVAALDNTWVANVAKGLNCADSGREVMITSRVDEQFGSHNKGPRLYVKGKFPFSENLDSDNRQIKPIPIGTVITPLGGSPLDQDETEWLERLLQVEVPGARGVFVRLFGRPPLEVTAGGSPPPPLKEQAEDGARIRAWMVIFPVVGIFVLCCVCVVSLRWCRKPPNSRMDPVSLSKKARGPDWFTVPASFDAPQSRGNDFAPLDVPDLGFATFMSMPDEDDGRQLEMRSHNWDDVGVPPHSGGTGAMTPSQPHSLLIMEALDDHLDSLPLGSLFHGGYELNGAAERRRGGQSLVQFATNAEGQQCVIKFYPSQQAFMHERSLYTNSLMSSAFPDMLEVFDSEEIGPIPSYTVFERGEPLDEWTQRNAPDLVTSIQVVWHVAQCLLKLHAAGYSHRDLKPSNTLWVTSSNRWTLIDMGCSAPIGTWTPMSFSFRYAAPETMLAFVRNDRSVVATAAVDAWALGVMAWELLTGDDCFPATMPTSKIVNMLMDDYSLPWETGRLTEAHKLRLGIMRTPVLGLLQRDPALRPSMQDVVSSMSNLFNNATDVLNHECAASTSLGSGSSNPPPGMSKDSSRRSTIS